MTDHERLLDALQTYCRGRARAETARWLQCLTRISPRRQQTIIRDLRRQGHMIGAATDKPMGYYLAATVAERQRVYAELTARARDIEETLRCMARANPDALQLELVG